MKNNKLNNSYLRRFSSTDLVITQQMFPSSLKNRYVPQNPLIFALQKNNKRRTDAFSPQQATYYGVFSLEKDKSTKVQEHRQDFEKSKSNSFNIKKIIEKSIRQDNIMKEQKHFSRTGFKQRLDRTMQKRIWSNYIQNELKNYQISDQLINLNKNLGVVVNRSKNTKSEVVDRRKSRLLYKNDKINEQNQQKCANKERTTYFVNNFIKTRIRKRAKVDQSPQIKTTKQKSIQLKILGRKEVFPEINWVIPWQKSHDTQEDAFMQS